MGLDHYRGGEGEPLVFIHGIGHTWRGWRPMLPLLEERFDVLAVDMLGHGHSEPLPGGVDSTPEALADAVEDEMGRAGFDSAHIAGNSLGGWVALELARRGRARTVTGISPRAFRTAVRPPGAWASCVGCAGWRGTRRRPSRCCATRSVVRSSRAQPRRGPGARTRTS